MTNITRNDQSSLFTSKLTSSWSRMSVGVISMIGMVLKLTAASDLK